MRCAKCKTELTIGHCPGCSSQRICSQCHGIKEVKMAGKGKKRPMCRFCREASGL